MNIKELRARQEEIIARLEGIDAEDLTDEQMDEITALHDEFEKNKKSIEAKEKLENLKNQASQGGRKTSPKQPENSYGSIQTRPSRKEKLGGFENFGDFAKAVKKASAGDIDERFKNNAMFERSGEDGGYLVPEEMMQEISEKVMDDDSLLSRTNSTLVSGNSLTLPVDEDEPWNGGIQSYWTEEGAQIQSSKPNIGRGSWRLNKLAALVKTTDELLDDAVALDSHIRNRAPSSMVHAINKAIIQGDGVGKPTGFLKSGFRYAQAPEGGQSSDTVIAENVVKMYSRMIPESRQRGVWLINPGVEPQLRLLKNGAGEYIYLGPGGQMNQTPYGQLLGRPVIPLLGGTPELGTEGDISFVDLDYYYTILKTSGPQAAISTHLLFDRDQTAYKFIFRIDGNCPYKSPITTEFGSYEMSGFITLQDR